MRDAPALNAIHHALKRGLEVVNAFTDTLEREHQALAGGDLAVLESVVIEKNGHVFRLEALTRELNTMLQQSGFPQGTSELDAFLRARNAGDVLHDWKEMDRLARRCHRQNQINAAICESKRRQVERTLSILHGVLTDQPLYGPRGTSTTAPGGSVQAII